MASNLTIRAYAEFYLDGAQINLGEYLQFLVSNAKYSVAKAWDLFINSTFCSQFESGSFYVLDGMSGIELALKVLEERRLESENIPLPLQYWSDPTPEYWAGWALAYYQWVTSLRFREITEAVSIDDVVGLYRVYHEMDITQFVDEMNRRYRMHHPSIRLKERRQKFGFSQLQLARMTGVSVRTIQEYEQRRKDINRAPAIFLKKLSQSLFCRVDDLLETVPFLD